MSAQIVQLTDLHLYTDREARLAGVPTWETFHAVLEQAAADAPDADYLVLSGDLAQDEALETYRMLREALGGWTERCRIIPGNHDDRANLRRVFPELFDAGDGALTFSVPAGGWRIVGLDSHVPGQINGKVSAPQLEWLRGELAKGPAAPTLIFIHHPPIPIDVAWLDVLGLVEPEALTGLIEAAPQVQVVCAGHVHQEAAGRIGAAAVLTTPSTCLQFGSRSERSYDTKAPGYRWFRLDRGGYRTEVRRVPE